MIIQYFLNCDWTTEHNSGVMWAFDDRWQVCNHVCACVNWSVYNDGESVRNPEIWVEDSEIFWNCCELFTLCWVWREIAIGSVRERRIRSQEHCSAIFWWKNRFKISQYFKLWEFDCSKHENWDFQLTYHSPSAQLTHIAFTQLMIKWVRHQQKSVFW